MTAAYPYARGPLLDEPNSYFYSAFEGTAFLDAWSQDRSAADRWFAATSAPAVGDDARDDPSVVLFRTLQDSLGTAAGAPSRLPDVRRLVQHFELTKRIFGEYDAGMRPVDREDFRVLARYVHFGQLLGVAHEHAQDLTCLNALIKVNDILVACRDQVPPALRDAAAALIRRERSLVCHVAQCLSISPESS